MNYWIIADSHLGHAAIQNYCGRPDGFEEKIFDNLFKTVKADDILIHLGDVCFGRERWWNYKFSLVGLHRWLILGNHDHNSIAWYLSHGWSFVADSFAIEIFGKKIVFSHRPLEDFGYDLNIHGHFHNNPDFHPKEPEMIKIKNNKQIRISMEWSHYQPYNLKTLIQKWGK